MNMYIYYYVNAAKNNNNRLIDLLQNLKKINTHYSGATLHLQEFEF